MIKNDAWIKEQAQQGMISPFLGELVRSIEAGMPSTAERFIVSSGPFAGVLPNYIPAISYGLSSYGYDIRLSPAEFKVFCHVPGTVMDPKDFNPNNLAPAELQEDENGSYFILPAHSYGLGVAKERLQVPDNITVVCIGKSTYARCGIIANLTPAEPGWVGHLTLEFSNSASADCRIYVNEGVVQLLFLEGEKCDTTYDQRNGKYQNQQLKVTLPKV